MGPGRKNAGIAVVGNLGFDRTLARDGHGVVRVQAFTPAGAAYYFAIGARRASDSIPVSVVSRTGRDFPLHSLQEDGVRVGGVHAVRGSLSPRFSVIYGPGEEREIRARVNAAAGFHPSSGHVQHLNAGFVHVATLPPRVQEEFTAFIREHQPQAVISIDTIPEFMLTKQPKALLNAVRGADVIFLNDEENDLYKTRFGAEGRRKLFAGKVLVIKSGARGARVEWQKGTAVRSVSCPAPRVSVVNPTGAGDLFAGAFLAGVSAMGGADALRNRNAGVFRKALKQAVNLASESVTAHGVEHMRRH